MSSSKNNMSNDDVHHSNPIPIGNARGRSRSMSISSASSGSASSNSDLPTPPSSMGQRISIPSPSPSASPILSYFMAQSPTKSPASTFPLRRAFAPAPVFEADETTEREMPVAAHARRASVNAANRFSGQNQMNPVPDAVHERGSGLLRRLSLSSAGFTKPQLDQLQRGGPPSPPPNTATSPTARDAPFTNRPRRSATLNADGPKPRRAPSPMGERILKGHFDGFN